MDTDIARFPRRKRAKLSIDQLIEWLRQGGCEIPFSRYDLVCTYDVRDHEIKELARRGLLVLSDAWDGSLTRELACRLESGGVTSREDFREKYLAGKLDMSDWLHIGKAKIAKFFVWAGLPVPDDGRRQAPVTLHVTTWNAMDVLVKQRGLRSRDELVTRLVMEASKAGDQKTG